MRRGLTRAETVAVALMTVMVGILAYPILVSARSHSRVSCASNLKQLANATLMYAADYEEHLPPANGWRGAVYPYVKNDGVWKCPQRSKNPTQKSGPDTYAVNAYVPGLVLDRVEQPGQVPLQFDARVPMTKAISTGSDFTPHPDGTAAVSYLDGRVRRVDSRFHLWLEAPRLRAVRIQGKPQPTP